MLNKIIDNGNHITFIRENITMKSEEDIPSILTYLSSAENESDRIGERIRVSKNYLRCNNIYIGGCIPYGYKKIGKKLVKCKYEQDTISFIRACKRNVVSSRSLNIHMKKISNSGKYIPIACYDDNGDKVKNIKSLSNDKIVELLNSYNIKKKGSKWNYNNLRSLLHSFNMI